MSQIFPENARVIQFPDDGHCRKYLIRTEKGVDLWNLCGDLDGSHRRDGSPASGWVAVRSWFSGRTGAEHWTVVEYYQEEAEQVKVDPRLVGPVPEPVKAPKYVLPFGVEDDTRVVDANGNTIVDVDLYHDYSLGDETAMARLIRDAVNAYLS